MSDTPLVDAKCQKPLTDSDFRIYDETGDKQLTVQEISPPKQDCFATRYINTDIGVRQKFRDAMQGSLKSDIGEKINKLPPDTNPEIEKNRQTILQNEFPSSPLSTSAKLETSHAQYSESATNYQSRYQTTAVSPTLTLDWRAINRADAKLRFHLETGGGYLNDKIETDKEPKSSDYGHYNLNLKTDFDVKKVFNTQAGFLYDDYFLAPPDRLNRTLAGNGSLQANTRKVSIEVKADGKKDDFTKPPEGSKNKQQENKIINGEASVGAKIKDDLGLSTRYAITDSHAVKHDKTEDSTNQSFSGVAKITKSDNYLQFGVGGNFKRGKYTLANHKDSISLQADSITFSMERQLKVGDQTYLANTTLAANRSTETFKGWYPSASVGVGVEGSYGKLSGTVSVTDSWQSIHLNEKQESNTAYLYSDLRYNPSDRINIAATEEFSYQNVVGLGESTKTWNKITASAAFLCDRSSNTWVGLNGGHEYTKSDDAINHSVIQNWSVGAFLMVGRRDK